MTVIGLTGGIGSGKTTVAHFFQELGVPVYFADTEAKELMQSSKGIKKKLIAEFGTKTYKKDGSLNRSFLAKLVFKDKKKLQIINAIVHPEVAQHFSEWVAAQKMPYVLQENAILFENNTADRFDYIITITAPVSVKIERVMLRDMVQKEDVILRMNNQFDDSKKIEHSDFVIENIHLKETKAQVEKLHKKILKLLSKKQKS